MNSKQKVEIGDFVIWVSKGEIRWEESRRLVYIEELEGDLWGWCDGGMTAILLEELFLEAGIV